MTDKHVGSRVSEDLYDELQRRDDLNVSGAIRQFLQEYAVSGQCTEAALTLRRERLEDELSDVEKRKKQLEREIDELSQKLEAKKDQRRDVYRKLDNAERPEYSQLSPEHPLVTELAEDTDISPAELFEEYKEWSQ